LWPPARTAAWPLAGPAEILAVIDHLYRKRPLNLAHRGALREAPENTLAAFRRALELGADGFELDAKLTRDDQVVVMHDATVDRTTDGAGRVSNFTLEQLRALDAGAWFDFEFRGEPVPTLDEVFAEFGPKALINVELTNYTSSRDGLEARVVALIHHHNLGRHVILSSFNPFAVRRVKRLDPSLPTAILTAPDMAIWFRRVWLAPLARHEARHPEQREVTEAYVRECRRKGLRIHAWARAEEDETPEGVRRLARLGVDGLICNRPEVVRDALRRVPLPHRKSER
jgi:glycerophosphoryl diester phosphodiesterase